MRDMLEIFALGSLTIERGGEAISGFASRKVEALLLYLAYERRTHPREVLAEFFWPDRSQTQSLANLRRALNSLRQHVSDYITITRDAVSLNPNNHCWLDARAFEACLSDYAESAALEQALALYQGDFLEGFYIDSPAFDDWAQLERDRLRYQALGALDALIDRSLDQSQWAQGIAYATRALQIDRLREKTHRQLMQLLAQSGQRVAALAQYETCHRLLTAELDVGPSQETTALYHQIQTGHQISKQPPLAVRPARTASGNPYKGLRPFQEADAPDFFGREALVAQIIAGLHADGPLARFIAVVGPSGCGKSSVVRAGLIPALRADALSGSDRWWIADMMPGTHPFEELEAALLHVIPDPLPSLLELLQRDTRGFARALKRVRPKDEAVQLLLIIDQFEEVFSLTTDETVRKRFLDGLLAAVREPHSYLRLLITVRADFYDRLLLYPELGQVVSQRTTTVLPLTPLELEHAIVGPAERVGLEVESSLVTSFIADVTAQPGNLPLLQYTLTEVFERREGQTLSLEAYAAAGGVQGALVRRADQLYAHLTPAQQGIARQLFLRLIQLGEGTEDTRRRVTLDEVAHIAVEEGIAEKIIHQFVAHRLLTLDHDLATGKPTVELAHEALIREWPRFYAWIEESRTHLRQQRLLAAAATEWAQADRDTSFLLTGSRLTQFKEWAKDTDVALTEQERAFLDASITERERQAEIGRERQARVTRLEQRARRVLQGMVGVFLLATIISVALALLALDERSTAQQERDSALRQAAVNQSLVLANEALEAFGNAKTDLALLLALEATNIDRPPADAVRALETIGLGLGVRTILREHGNAINSIAFGPDSRLALSGGCAEMTEEMCVASELVLWDIETGTECRRFEGPGTWVNDVAFGPDGKTALAAYDDGTIILWDTATGGRIRQFRGHDGAVNSAAFSPDGTMIVSGGADNVVLLWDTHSGEVIRRLEGHTDQVTVVTFSPDGKLFASSSDDTTSILWTTATGEPLHRFEGHTSGVSAAAFRLGRSGNTTTFLSTAANNLREWNVDTGETIRVQEMPCFPIDDLVVSPDGRIAVTDQCDTVDLWDLEEWHSEQHADVRPHPMSLAISPDGHLLLSGHSDGALYLLNMPTSAEIRRLGTDVPLVSLDMSPDGRYLLTGALHGGVAVLWDTETGQEIRRFEGHEDSIIALRFGPDGRHAVIASADWWGNSEAMKLVLLDIKTGEEILLEGYEFGIRTIAFSPDGRMLLTGSVKFNAVPGDDEGNLILWDTQTGAQIRKFEETRSVFAVRFSADGRLTFTGSNLQPDFVKVWDVSTGQEIDRLEVPGGILTLLLGQEEDTLLADLKLVDLQSKEIIRRFTGHRGGIVAADMSDDGRYLISGDSQGDIILWDFASGEAIRRLTGHTAMIWGLAFSPDGQTAFSSAFDGTLRQWQIGDLALEDSLDWIIEHRYLRDFTCDERAQYRIEPLCE